MKLSLPKSGKQMANKYVKYWYTISHIIENKIIYTDINYNNIHAFDYTYQFFKYFLDGTFIGLK